MVFLFIRVTNFLRCNHHFSFIIMFLFPISYGDNSIIWFSIFTTLEILGQISILLFGAFDDEYSSCNKEVTKQHYN